MHLLIGVVLVVGGLGLWYLRGRLRFNRSNGRPAETYRSFHHKLVSRVIDRVLSVAVVVLVFAGVLLLT